MHVPLYQCVMPAIASICSFFVSPLLTGVGRPQVGHNPVGNKELTKSTNNDKGLMVFSQTQALKKSKPFYPGPGSQDTRHKKLYVGCVIEI